VPAVVGGGNPAGARRWAQLDRDRRRAGRRAHRPAGARAPSCTSRTLKEVICGRAPRTAIRADFDRLTTAGGYSVREAIFELGIQHGCSGKAIENAIARPDNVRGEPVQGVLF
jgi:hypothetical protein